MATPDRIVVSRGPGESRAALLAGDQLIEIVHQRDADVQPGGHYRGRIGKPNGEANGVFVDLGRGPAGLLQTKTKLPGEGRNVIVSVAAAAHADKGPKLKLIDVDGGTGSPQLLRSAPDPVLDWVKRYAGTIRTIMFDRPADAKNYSALSTTQVELHPVASAKSLFDAYGIEDVLAQAIEPRVELAGGGSIVIESTAAAVTIDVNAGGQPAARANLAAADVIARELRLRNASGHILIDFIPVKNRRALIDQFRSALTDDPAAPEIAGFTPLGMIEMTRKRTRPSLTELLGTAAKPDPYAMAYRALRLAVRTARQSGKPHVKISIPAAPGRLLSGALNAAMAEAKAAIGGDILISSHGPGVDHDLSIEAFA